MNQKKELPSIIFVPLMIGVIGGILYLFDTNELERKQKVKNCIEIGVNFYKENTNSYPTFLTYPNKGRLTYDVVKEECEQNPSSYDDI